MTRRFDEFYLAALRSLYDAERLQCAELAGVARAVRGHRGLVRTLGQLESTADEQTVRLEAVFGELYQKPTTEPCWIVAALLREAADNARVDEPALMASGVAVALLSVKRYEITRYEALMRWSMHCGVDEALPLLGRSLAEEIVMADALSALAFEHFPLLADAPVPPKPAVISQRGEGAA